MNDEMSNATNAIKALSNAFREFTVTMNKQQIRITEIYFPKYMLTEWRFPKKKPRGTMRRKRREKRRLA